MQNYTIFFTYIQFTTQNAQTAILLEKNSYFWENNCRMSENCKMQDGIKLGIEVESELSDLADQISIACQQTEKAFTEFHHTLVSLFQGQASILSNMEVIYRYKTENSWCYLMQIWYYRKYYKARRARIFMERRILELRRTALK